MAKAKHKPLSTHPSYAQAWMLNDKVNTLALHLDAPTAELLLALAGKESPETVAIRFLRQALHEAIIDRREPREGEHQNLPQEKG